MSNNDTEVFNLCKAVYEATGWKTGWPDSQFWLYQPYKGDKRRREFYEKYKLLTFDEVDGLYGAGAMDEDTDNFTPLYTSDYLLEKLLPITTVRLFKMSNGEVGLMYEPIEPDYDDYVGKSALHCLLKLTLTLHKQERI